MLTYLTIEKAVQGNRLELSNQNINDDDMVLLCLFLKEHLDIDLLNLNYNDIGAAGAKALADNKTLTALDVRFNKIGDEGAKALADNKTLTFLKISYNAIGAAGAKALSDNKTLTSLDVHGNNISAEGAKALADNKTLKSLDVRFNNIGAAGAKALADNNTLMSLAVNDRNISKEIKQVIDERIQLNINNIAQYKEECRTIVSLLSETSSFFNTNRLPKDMTHVILQKLTDAYEFPYDKQAVNKIMSAS